MKGPTSIVVASALCLVACGPGDRDNNNNGGPDGGGGGDGTTGGDNCPEEAKLVYTVDQNNTLSKFDPPTKMFMDLGQLDCPAQVLASPFSMGIDRTATAYVLYSSGELFRVDTGTLACTKMAWTPGQNGLMQFGMGFSTEAAGGTVDTLFIAGGSGPTNPSSALNRLDVSTFTPTPVGTVQGWPELSGTGNAELWGFFPDASAPRVAQLDKTNGTALRTHMVPALAGDPTAWAFAAWGGDFWLFLMKDLEGSTTVHQIDGMTGQVKTSTATNTRTIVGAGVSTCAPVIL